MLTDDQRDTVEQNMTLAFTHANRLGGRYFDDLLSMSFLGLVRAAQLYDPERGVEFSSYAVMWMRRMTLRFRDSIPMVHLPTHARYDYKHPTCIGMRQRYQTEIARAKGSKKCRSKHLHLTVCHQPSVESETERTDEVEWLRNLISQLTGDEKRIFDLLLCDKGVNEIARLIDMKRSTVSTIKMRVIERFRGEVTRRENVAWRV